MRDLDERDAFAERLKNKDKAKTKSVGDKSTGAIEAVWVRWLGSLFGIHEGSQ